MAYINGIGVISPQKTTEPGSFLPEVMEYTADFLRCIDPNYRNFIDPILGRRMSRLIKMGITSAKICVADAGDPMPDAIITGTGLGSVEDTEKILGELIKEEKFLNPTPFIQSTYNTISSQIAINLKCHNYNATYVHRTFSFESGLLDAMMQLEEKMGNNMLVGGIDEMTLNHLEITRRTGMWKREPVNNLGLLQGSTPGALAGEGAAFFMLGDQPGPNTYGILQDISIQFSPGNSYHPGDSVKDFLKKNGLALSDIDLLLLGLNGDPAHDLIDNRFAGILPHQTATAWYKHLCGEFNTATGFALYLASNILKHQYLPEILRLNNHLPGEFNSILIYNQFRNTNHSLILVKRNSEACLPVGR